MEIYWFLFYKVFIFNIIVFKDVGGIDIPVLVNNNSTVFDSLLFKINDNFSISCLDKKLRFKSNFSDQYNQIDSLNSHQIKLDNAGIYKCSEDESGGFVIIHVHSDVTTKDAIAGISVKEETLKADSKKINYNKKYLKNIPVIISATCSTTGISDASKMIFKWTYDLSSNTDLYSIKKVSKDDKFVSELSLLAVDTKHEKAYGSYNVQCVFDGTKSPAGVAHIFCPPILPSFRSSLNVKMGSPTTISCLPLVYFNKKVDLKIDWQFNEKPIDLDSSGNLKFLNVSKFGVNVQNAELQIKETKKEHRGPYTCFVTTDIGTESYNDTTMFYLRVKDPWAVLWPFIGICAEVILLVAIILVYERKRMTDKANARGLDVDVGALPNVGGRPAELDKAKAPLQSIPEQPEPVKSQTKDLSDLRKRAI